MVVETLAIPLVAASVFTIGGYGIVRAGPRHAEWIGHVLAITFILCAFLTTLTVAVHLAGPMVSREALVAAQARRSKTPDRVAPVPDQVGMN